ncbi:hypothetical protein WMY93_008169 [Mugilogobius chulae]|uniref:Helix-turn-helix domain-containing protein n=1 Tax=Mugilogobius chulae TaxID=88201 RepID=A0AAW0PTT1_9GOBI
MEAVRNVPARPALQSGTGVTPRLSPIRQHDCGGLSEQTRGNQISLAPQEGGLRSFYGHHSPPFLEGPAHPRHSQRRRGQNVQERSSPWRIEPSPLGGGAGDEPPLGVNALAHRLWPRGLLYAFSPPAPPSTAPQSQERQATNGPEQSKCRVVPGLGVHGTGGTLAPPGLARHADSGPMIPLLTSNPSHRLLVWKPRRKVDRGTALSSQRLAHWVCQAGHMTDEAEGRSPPALIRARFTWCVATFSATLRGVPLEEICLANSWSSLSTFVQSYLLDVTVRGNFYRQIHGCAMGSPVSPIVANLYMEEVEKKALTTFPDKPPSHWFRYVDDTFVKIKKQDLEAFTSHINAVDSNIKFTREDSKDNQLAFLDCSAIIGEDGKLQLEVYRKPTHTDQYLLFDSNHPLQHKLGVIRTLQHRAEEVPTSSEGKKKETQHVQKALSACGYPKWALNRAKRPKKQEKRETEKEKRKNGVSIPYVSGLSEKLQRIFRQHDIPVFFKPVNTLRQKLVHPKDKMPTEKQSNVVYSIRCSEDCCNEHYIGETKQPLHKRHRREATSGPQSAVHLHLKATKHKFEDSEVKILSREKGWFERGVKEAIFVKKENPSLNRNGGLRYNLPGVYSSILTPWSKGKEM